MSTAALFSIAKTGEKPKHGVRVQNITQPHKKIMNGRRDYNTKSDKDKHHMISHKKIMNGRRDYNTKSDKDKHHMISFMWDT